MASCHFPANMLVLDVLGRWFMIARWYYVVCCPSFVFYFSFGVKNAHERSCDFRPYPCPSPGDCFWEGELEQVMGHLRQVILLVSFCMIFSLFVASCFY